MKVGFFFKKDVKTNPESFLMPFIGFQASSGQLQQPPPTSQDQPEQQISQQNHSNFQSDQAQQSYDWNQYNQQQHLAYNEQQPSYNYWDGNNYVNYVSHLHSL